MTEQKPEVKLSVLRTHFKGNEYGLSITVENTHTGLDSHSYPHIPGNRSDLVIFNLTLENILHLGHLIVEKGLVHEEKT